MIPFPWQRSVRPSPRAPRPPDSYAAKIAPALLDPALDGPGLTPDYRLPRSAEGNYRGRTYEIYDSVIW